MRLSLRTWRVDLVVDLARDVREGALPVRQALLELRLVDLDDRRQLGRVRRRVLDHTRVGDDRGLRHRHREELAGAVEDVATLRRDGDRAHALTETERHEVRAVAGLEVEEAHPDGGERQHHDDEDGDEAQPDRRQRARDRASGAAMVRGRAGRVRAVGRAWRLGTGARRAAGARAGHARDAAPRSSGGPRSGHGCWGPRLGFAFDQFGDGVGGRAVVGRRAAARRST